MYKKEFASSSITKTCAEYADLDKSTVLPSSQSIVLVDSENEKFLRWVLLIFYEF